MFVFDSGRRVSTVALHYIDKHANGSSTINLSNSSPTKTNTLNPLIDVRFYR